MKNKMKNLLKRVIAFFIMLVEIVVCVPAEIFVNEEKALYHLEQYFDKADMERDEARWEQLAEEGILQAMVIWENENLELLEINQKDWLEEKENIEESFKKEKEKRYMNWIIMKFYETKNADSLRKYEEELNVLVDNWQYTTADGNKTNEIQPNDFFNALDQWKEETYKIFLSENNFNITFGEEIEQKFENISLDENVKNQLISTAVKKQEEILYTEFNRLAQIEGMKKIGNFLYDRNSLKKITAEEAATLIATNLAQEAISKTSNSIENLFNDLESSDIKDESEWLQKFQYELQKGLTVWKESELTFLTERAEWERNAENVFINTEIEWNNAYQKLSAEKKQWEQQFLERINENYKKWQEKNEKLSMQIAAARQELEKAIYEERTQLEQSINLQFEIYNQSRDMLASCKEGIEGWFSQWRNDYIKVYKYWNERGKTEKYFSNGIIEGISVNGFEENTDYDCNLKDFINNKDLLKKQIDDWKIAYKSMTIIENKALYESSESLLNEKSGWIVLAERTYEKINKSIETLYSYVGNTVILEEDEYISNLDKEYQKTKAVLEFWKEELEVAQALNEYIKNTTSTVDTKDETYAKLELKTKEYKEKLDEYEQVVKESQDYYKTITKYQNEYKDFSNIVSVKQKEVEIARENYQQILIMVNGVEVDTIKDSIERLMESLNNVSDKTEKIRDYQQQYYELISLYYENQNDAEKNIVLNMIENGTSSGMKSVQEIESLIDMSKKLQDVNIAENLSEVEVFLEKILQELPTEYSVIQQNLLFDKKNSNYIIKQVLKTVEAYYEKELKIRNESKKYIENIDEEEIWNESFSQNFSDKQIIENYISNIKSENDTETKDFIMELENLLKNIDDNFTDEDFYLLENENSDLSSLVNLILKEIKLIDSQEDRKKQIKESYKFLRKEEIDKIHNESIIKINDFFNSKNILNIENFDQLIIEIQKFEEIINGLKNTNFDVTQKYIDNVIKYFAIKDFYNDEKNQDVKDCELESEKLVNLYNEKNEKRLKTQYLQQEIFTLDSIFQMLDLNLENIKSDDLEKIIEISSNLMICEFDFDLLSNITTIEDFYLILENYTENNDEIGGENYKSWVNKYLKLEKNIKNEIAKKLFEEKNNNKDFYLNNFLFSLEDYQFLCGVISDILEKQNQEILQLNRKMLYWDEYKKELSLNIVDINEQYNSFKLDEKKAYNIQNKLELLRSVIENYKQGITLNFSDFSIKENDFEQLEHKLLQNQYTIDFLLNDANTLEEITIQLKLLEKNKMSKTDLEKEFKNLENALKESEIALEKAKENQINSAKKIDIAIEMYNDKVSEIDTLYTLLQKAALEKRIEQEKYDWAVSIYLNYTEHETDNLDHSYKNPEEKIKEAENSVKLHSFALSVFEKLLGKDLTNKNENYLTLMEEYEISYEKYYKTVIIENIIANKIVEQEAKIENAEKNLKASLSNIIKNKYDKEKNPVSFDLVRIKEGDNGNFTISLAYETKSVVIGTEIIINADDSEYEREIYATQSVLKTNVKEQDKNIINNYFKIEEDSDKEDCCSKAEIDAEKWLKDVSKNDYIDEIMLASLYVKTYMNDEKYLDGCPNIFNGIVFAQDMLPSTDKFQGFNIAKEYKLYREKVLKDAYKKVLEKSTGEEDIAKYILYSETLFTENLKLRNREKTLIEIRALEYLSSEISRQEEISQIAGAANIAMATAFSISAFFQPWLAVAAVTSAAIGAWQLDVSSSLKQVNNQLEDLQKGKINLKERNTAETKKLLKDLDDSYKKLEIEQNILTEMRYGKKENGNSVLTYENFLIGIDKLLEKNNFANSDLIKSLFLEDIFNKSHANQTTNTIEAVIKIEEFLKNEYEINKKNKDETVQELRQKQEIARQMYEEKIKNLESYELEEQKAKEIEFLIENTFELWNEEEYKKNIANIEYRIYTENSNVEYNVAEYEKKQQEKIKEAILENFEINNKNKLICAEKIWEIEKKQQVAQQDSWEKQIEEIEFISRSEWKKATEILNKNYNSWRKQFEKEYEEKTKEWQTNYEKFLEEKEKWIIGEYIRIASGADENSEHIVSEKIKELELNSKIERMLEKNIESDEYIKELLGETRLEEILKENEKIQGNVNTENVIIKVGTKFKSDKDTVVKAQAVLDSINQDMETAAGKIAGQQALEMIKEMIKSYKEIIEKENKNIRSQQKEMLLNDGYSVGEENSREVVIGATYANPITEKQTVHKYSFFEVKNIPTVEEDLKVALQGNIEGNKIIILIENAQKKLTKWIEDIFGSKSDKEDIGLFGKHVGKAPELKENPDINGAKEAAFKENTGSGEYGKIMMDYQWNNLRANIGMQELSKAGYDKKLWDDTDTEMQAPTIREVVDIAMSVVGTMTGCEKLVGYIDDALFMITDLASGYKTAGQIGNELVQKAVNLAVGAKLGELNNFASDTIAKSLSESGKLVNFMSQAAINGGTAYVGSVANGYVNALDLTKLGTSEWIDWEKANSSWSDTSNISCLVGSFVSGGFSGINSQDGQGLKLNEKLFATKNIKKYNDLLGGLASAGMTYALTGNTTFNIGKIRGINFLELNVGKDGFRTKIGKGGTDITFETLIDATKGYYESKKVTDWKYGSMESENTLNAINMLSTTYTATDTNKLINNYIISELIWDDKIKVAYGDLEGRGRYKQKSGIIEINENLLGTDIETLAKLATVMSHEGSHVLGNRIEALAHLAGAETYSQVNEMFGLQADASFSMEMIAGINNPENWKMNIGDMDYWKFEQNDDGSFGWSWDNDFDFNIGDKTKTAEEMKGIIISNKLFENKSFLTRLGLGYLYQSKDKQATFISLTPSESTQAQKEMFYSFIQAGGVDGIKAYEEFISKTEGFADASIAAKQLKNILNQKEINPRELNPYLKQMNTALYTAQNSGLLVKNAPLTIDTTNLIGTGTTSSPYFPLAGYGTENPYVKITSYKGWRLVDSEMAAIPSGNYVLNEFSPYYHKGWDGVGSGNIVASLNGGLYLDYLNAEGFQVNNTTELGTFNTSHASANTIDQYFSLFGQNGINMNYNNGTYLLTGLQAGNIIGYMGNTGANTTGTHAHMSLNGKGDRFASVFNNSSYSTNFSSDYYAEYMSGYSYPSMNNNPELWQKVQNYANQRPDLLNWDDFTMHNSEDYMSLFWNKYPRLEK